MNGSSTPPGASRHGGSPGRVPRSGVRHRGERGVAASFVVVLAGVLVLVTVGATMLGRVLVEQRRVAAAADFAALAGAVAMQEQGEACAAAAETAGANGAELAACQVMGDRVKVTAAGPALTLLGRVIVVTAEAQAGPR